MIKKKRFIAIVAIIALVIVCAVSLVGCGGQKINAEEFADIFKSENLNKIENFSYSIVTKSDKDTSYVENYVVDGKLIKYSSVDGAAKKAELAAAKEQDRDSDANVFQKEIFYDLENNVMYTKHFKVGKGDKDKYAKTDKTLETSKYVISEILAKYMALKFEDFEQKGGLYTNVNKAAGKTATIEIRFSKNKIYYLTDFVKSDGVKFNEKEFYFEVYKETVKLPKDKQIA